MKGKRGRGRPRQKLMDWMMEDIYENLKEKAQKAGGVESMDIWTFGQKTYNLKKEVTSGYVDNLIWYTATTTGSCSLATRSSFSHRSSWKIRRSLWTKRPGISVKECNAQ